MKKTQGQQVTEALKDLEPAQLESYVQSLMGTNPLGEAYQAATIYGQACVRGLYLLNGGAAVAVLALTGRIWDVDPGAQTAIIMMKDALLWYVLGLIFAFAVGVAGFFAQSSYFASGSSMNVTVAFFTITIKDPETFSDFYDAQIAKISKISSQGNKYFTVAVIAAIPSILCFFFGSMQAFAAFTQTG